VHTISASCFAYCERLSVVLFAPDSQLKVIEQFAFGECPLLHFISFPPSLEQIGAHSLPPSCFDALYADPKHNFFGVFRDFLTSAGGVSLLRYLGDADHVVIDKAVERIEAGCFAQSEDLDALMMGIEEDSSTKSTIRSVTFEAGSVISLLGDGAFGCCYLLESICIPASVEVISHSCFADCANLLLLTFEAASTLSILGGFAFSGCKSLQSICLPASLTTISEDCFQYCANLSQMTFEEGSRLSTLGEFVFWDCQNLKSICLPPLLQNGLGLALVRSSLRDISIHPDGRFVKRDNDFLADYSGISLLRYLGAADEVCISKAIERIGAGCFNFCKSTRRVTFEPESRLKVIGDSAFADSSLGRIEIPSSVEIIGTSCFTKCEALSAVTVAPNSRLSMLGERAFSRSYQLKSVGIPASVQVISKDCFAYCSRLVSVSFEPGSRVSVLSECAFSHCSLLESICIPSSVEMIGKYCFDYCLKLLRVTFETGSKLSVLRGSAFAECSSLQAICIPSAVQKIGHFCFYGCSFLASVTFEENSRLLVLGSFAFACCGSLQMISLPSSVQEISDFCFFDRTNHADFPAGSGWSLASVRDFPSPVFRRSSEPVLSAQRKYSGHLILCQGFPRPRHSQYRLNC
jgi:hypothetical protein